MTTQIIVTSENVNEHGDKMVAWLNRSVGPGSLRQRTNTWMGAEDWFYYLDVPPPVEDFDDIEDSWDEEEVEYNYVFVFRREADATIFALKWLK